MRKITRFLLLVCLTLGMAVETYAQQRTITGKVVGSDDGLGLPAAVQVKGTTKGAVANIDGVYSITANQGQTLVFSSLGYTTQEVVVGNQNSINVTMPVAATKIGEAVVVGYGTQRKENLTGAVASIDVNKTLDSRPIADVGRGLQGVTPGLTVTIPSGEVGSDPTMKIRGAVASVNGGSSPLILYDGVEIPSISIINPDDVESISILKDAASASIYGAKAAFGVILITSKKGSRTEKVTVSYSGNFSWQNTAYDIDMGMLDALHYTVDAAERVGTTAAVGFITKVDRQSYLNAIKWNEKYGKTVGKNDPYVYGRDWYINPASGGADRMGIRLFNSYDYMVREYAPATTHNLSVSGRAGTTTFNIGLGYLMQNGMMKPAKHDDFERYNASINLTTQVNKWFTANAGFIYSKRNKRYAYAGGSTADPWLYIYRWGSTVPMVENEDGQNFRNSISEVHQANTAHIYNSYTSVNAGGLFTFTPNWTLNAQFTYSTNNGETFQPGTRYTGIENWYTTPIAQVDAGGNQKYITDEWGVYGAEGSNTMPLYAYRTANGASTLAYEYTTPGTGMDFIYRNAGTSERTNTDIYTTYNLNINDIHNFKFMAGLNRVTYKYTSTWAQRMHLLDISNPQFSLADGTQTNGGSKSWEAQLGYFARINYAYKDKYLLEANVRYDGTSKFGMDYAWNWYYSGSIGWKFSDESFMQWAKPILSSGKFRASYGIIGDQTVSNSLYIPTMSSGTGNWLGGTSSTKYPYFTMPSIVSGGITWQDIESFDIGADFRFFNNKLGLTVDWFRRTTKNMIVAGATAPSTLGTSAPQGNYGSLRTQGWEIALDFNHRFANGLGINVTASFSDYKSKITKYAEGADKNLSNTWWEGKTYGDIYGYKTDRLYTWDDFVLTGDGTKKWANLQKVKLGAASVTASESAQGIIADPNAGRTNYGQSAGKVVYMQKNHETAVYQGGLQSGLLYFGPGDVKYKDLNGDGDIYYGTNVLNHYDEDGKFVDSQGDLAKIGNSTPRYEYGVRLGADWKGFDFSIFFQGVGKRSVVPTGNLAVEGYNSSDGCMPQAIAGNYWTWDETTQTGNTNAYYPRAVNAGGDPGRSSFNNTIQSKYLLNMAYCRIKNITLGYTFPEKLTKKIYMEKARIYFSLENYFTFDHLHNLPIDPEELAGYSIYNSGDYNAGRTGVGTPTFKSLSFGVQLTF